MRNHLVHATMVLFLVIGVGLGEEKAKSKEGRFSVIFPGKYIISKQDVKTQIGNVVAHTYAHSVPAFGTFIVAYSDYPEGYIAKQDKQKVLDGARDGAAKNTGGRVAAEKKISIAGHPGRIVDIVNDTKGFGIRSKIFLVDDRLYQILVVAIKKDDIEAEKVSKFLDSFSLTE